MTELSFLVDLLLNHKLPKATRDLVASRIKEVEGRLTPYQGLTLTQPQIPPPPVLVNGAPQAASTIAAMARHAEAAPVTMPVAIAQTAATAAALNSRHQAISESIAGKIDKVTGRPRKF